MKIKLLCLVLMLNSVFTSFAQDEKYILTLQSIKEISFPAQTADQIGCCKWQIREERIDSVCMEKDTLQLYINRGDAVLLNNNRLHPNLFVWEIPVQLFHRWQKLIITVHSAYSDFTIIMLHMDWKLYVFQKKNRNHYMYISETSKPTPTPEVIISKKIPVKRDFPYVDHK